MPVSDFDFSKFEALMEPESPVSATPESFDLSRFDALMEESVPEVEPKYNIMGALVDVGRGFLDLPTHVKGSLGSLLEGENPRATINFLDRWREESEELATERLTAPGGEERILPPNWILPEGLTRKHIREGSASSGFSAVGMGAGLLGGVIAAPVPVPGAITAGRLAGSALAAKRMSQTQFTDRMLDAYEVELGRVATSEEISEFLIKTEDIRLNYALWEAIPEAVGNVFEMSGIGALFNAAMGKKFGLGVLKKVASAYGVELGTETITQMGQFNAEIDAKLEEGGKRSFTSVEDWRQSYKEVAGPTVAMVTAMQGGGYLAGKAAPRTKEPEPFEPPPKKTVGDIATEDNVDGAITAAEEAATSEEFDTAKKQTALQAEIERLKKPFVSFEKVYPAETGPLDETLYPHLRKTQPEEPLISEKDAVEFKERVKQEREVKQEKVDSLKEWEAQKATAFKELQEKNKTRPVADRAYARIQQKKDAGLSLTKTEKTIAKQYEDRQAKVKVEEKALEQRFEARRLEIETGKAAFESEYEKERELPPKAKELFKEEREVKAFEEKVRRELQVKQKEEKRKAEAKAAQAERIKSWKVFSEGEMPAKPPEIEIPEQTKKDLLKEARAEVDENPIFKVMAEARRQTLNLKELYKDYDKDTVKEISRKLPAIFSYAGKTGPDGFASEQGFESLDDMIEAFKAAPSKKKTVEQLMAQKSGEWQAAEEQAREVVDVEEKLEREKVTPVEILEQALPKKDVSYDGAHDFGKDKPKLHSFTVQSGKYEGNTFDTLDVSLEGIKKAFIEMKKRFDKVEPAPAPEKTIAGFTVAELGGKTVTVEALDEQTGKVYEMEENAEAVLTETEDKIESLYSLLECLKS